LEEQALRQAAYYWQVFPENFQYESPYVCGKAWTPRIADIILLHLFSPPSPKPMSAADVEAKLEGAHQKQNINLLSHYSKAGSFRSFFWGPGPVVRHIEPKDNGWMLLPLNGNYRARINGKLKPDRGVKTFSGKGEKWFWVLRSYPHSEQEAFVSLPDETVVMMSVISSEGADSVDSVVNIEKPHKTFVVHYRDGKATYRYGQRQWDRSDKVTGLELKTQWVNLADSIGYVTVNLSQDSMGMALPKPGVRSGLSCYHVKKPKDSHQRFITVAFPNQTHEETKAMVARVTGSYADGVMTCLTPSCFVWANFSNEETSVQPPEALQLANSLKAPPNVVGILHRTTSAMTEMK
jgi:hypothetical protein